MLTNPARWDPRWPLSAINITSMSQLAMRVTSPSQMNLVLRIDNHRNIHIWKQILACQTKRMISRTRISVPTPLSTSLRDSRSLSRSQIQITMMQLLPKTVINCWKRIGWMCCLHIQIHLQMRDRRIQTSKIPSKAAMLTWTRMWPASWTCSPRKRLVPNSTKSRISSKNRALLVTSQGKMQALLRMEMHRIKLIKSKHLPRLIHLGQNCSRMLARIKDRIVQVPCKTQICLALEWFLASKCRILWVRKAMMSSL